MNQYEICRICLRINVKMFPMNQFSLKMYYEQLIVEKLPEDDELPKFFCYECAAMLNKAYKFKLKCYRGQKILEELMFAQCQVTYLSVSLVDRKINSLISPLKFCEVTNRVKTYTIEHEPTGKTSDIVIKKTKDKRVNNEVVDIAETSESAENISIHDDDTTNGYDEDSNGNLFASNMHENECNVDSTPDDESNMKIDEIENNNDSKMNENNQSESDEEDHKRITTFANESKMDESLIELPETVKNCKNAKDPLAVENTEIINKSKTVSNDKKYKFETEKVKRKLDPQFWLKINMNEEEAIMNFHKRGEDEKYLKANFKCVNCYKWFSLQEMLDRHKELRHKESIGQHNCRLCHMRFRRPHKLRHHMKEHYVTYKCLRCGARLHLEESARHHDAVHSDKKKTCKICGKEFKHLSTYYTHLRTHRSEHLCTLCGASFVSELGLRLHKKTKHIPGEVATDTEDSTFCEKCDITFATRDAFDQHVFHSDRHTDNGPETVLGLKSTEEITKHRRRGIHYGQSRSSKSNKVRKRPARLPTTCPVCGVYFKTQAQYLTHHRLEHPGAPQSSSVVCEICGKRLSSKTIQTHLNVHSKEVKYPCDTCGKVFYVATVLKIHQLTHSDFKPEACKLCDKRFKQVSSLALHHKTFHLKQPYPKRNRSRKPQQEPCGSENIDQLE